MSNPRYLLLPALAFLISACSIPSLESGSPREKISFNRGWKFFKYQSEPDSFIYDIRPEVVDKRDDKVADSRPTEAVRMVAERKVLKDWILPSGNDFVADPAGKFLRPKGEPVAGFPFLDTDFDDSKWEDVNLPHDWAINGPFMEGPDAEVGGGMGRLPSHGVAWYRKQFVLPASDQEKKIYLDIDGAMSYAMVWINGHLAGGWPYGYNSFRVDLTDFVKPGATNQLAIRLDNPPNSSRWYPGGGIYRNVWLTKTTKVHVDHWGSYVTTPVVSKEEARIDLELSLKNDSRIFHELSVVSDLYLLNQAGEIIGKPVSKFPRTVVSLPAKTKKTVETTLNLTKPQLWGPFPEQTAHMYRIVTRLLFEGKVIDSYETDFGIRDIKMDANQGLIVNGQPIRIKGVNQHHDLGALGAAFNYRAAERQLEILQEMGCNAIRMAHNPPAPELLDLADRMGFVVIDEVFDSWERKKTPLDFHLIFPDWYEQDIRSFIRRDKNHPSVIAWSYGNEVGEQYTGEEGGKLAKKLRDIVRDEDPSRPATASMNFAKPDMPFPEASDLISLNYQGEGIRDAPAYQHLQGIKTSPLYPAFREKFPDKMIVSSETASALSTRGTYIFPVYEGVSAPVGREVGGDPRLMHVSSYELYTAAFGASADKVFGSQDKHPYVSGEFVWSGWDYLGEPTPYYNARSSYSGIIDLAGFKKDRFFLYQARWKPETPMVHILPHWTWPERKGLVTPVHVFTSGDEAEIFLNGKSLGRKKKLEGEYRIRWDDVIFEPGELKAVAYKNGKKWAEATARTAGSAAEIRLSADKTILSADGQDLVFVTATVFDERGVEVPTADHLIRFTTEGPGMVLATDNGNPGDMDEFNLPDRRAFSGKALCIVKSEFLADGMLSIRAEAEGLKEASLQIKLSKP